MKRQKVKHSSVQKRHKAGVDSDSNEDLNTETEAKHHVDGIEANQNEAALEIETSPTLAVYDLESDGIADIHDDAAIGSRVETLTNITRNKLPAGFGFTKETCQYRHDTGRSTNASLHAPKPVVYEIGESVVEGTDNVDVSVSDTNNQISNGAEYNTAKTQKYVAVVHGASNQQSINNDIELVATNQASIGKHISTEQMQTPDIEMDVIYTRKLQEATLEEAPKSVPSDYVDMSPKNQPAEHKMTFICMIPIGRKEPDQTSSVLIPHRGADKPEGDEFGTRLCTFIEKRKSGHVYYRHFFVDVEPDGPADCMRIEENDEIVLLNDVFVAALTHTETLNLLHKVKVDGHTRFTLVIRRVEEVQNNTKWQWIETSAILAPDKEKDDRPIVEDVEYKPLRGNTIEVPKSRHLYKVPGTDRYLEISTRSAYIDVPIGNDIKQIIWKRLVYRQNDSGYIVDMRAALCDHTMTSYIAFDQQDKIILQPKPEWFKIITVGDRVRFKLENKDLYLGYNLDTGQINAQISQCVFHELPPPKDGEVRQPSTSRSSNSATEDAGQSSSCRSSRSSVSSQISTDASGCNVSFRHSNSSDSTASSTLSLSQSCSQDSNTSGYISTTSPNSQPEDMDTGELHDMSLDLPVKHYESENTSFTTPETPTTRMASLALHDDNIIGHSKGY